MKTGVPADHRRAVGKRSRRRLRSLTNHRNPNQSPPHRRRRLWRLPKALPYPITDELPASDAVIGGDQYIIHMCIYSQEEGGSALPPKLRLITAKSPEKEVYSPDYKYIYEKKSLLCSASLGITSCWIPNQSLLNCRRKRLCEGPRLPSSTLIGPKSSTTSPSEEEQRTRSLYTNGRESLYKYIYIHGRAAQLHMLGVWSRSSPRSFSMGNASIIREICMFEGKYACLAEDGVPSIL